MTKYTKRPEKWLTLFNPKQLNNWQQQLYNGLHANRGKFGGWTPVRSIFEHLKIIDLIRHDNFKKAYYIMSVLDLDDTDAFETIPKSVYNKLFKLAIDNDWAESRL